MPTPKQFFPHDRTGRIWLYWYVCELVDRAENPGLTSEPLGKGKWNPGSRARKVKITQREICRAFSPMHSFVFRFLPLFLSFAMHVGHESYPNFRPQPVSQFSESENIEGAKTPETKKSAKFSILALSIVLWWLAVMITCWLRAIIWTGQQRQKIFSTRKYVGHFVFLAQPEIGTNGFCFSFF